MSDPDINCPLCPRLVAYREENRKVHPDWHNSPVRSIGKMDAELLILGLAPGLKGANRTGRPFTGDYAGQLLYSTLLEFEFAIGNLNTIPGHGVRLRNCRIANAVRCVPPQNKPSGSEIKACASFLEQELDAMPNLKVVLALGTLAHYSVLTIYKLHRGARKFGHNTQHDLSSGVVLLDSYHCSRYNTNTGRLTEKMFHDVFRNIRNLIRI